MKILDGSQRLAGAAPPGGNLMPTRDPAKLRAKRHRSYLRNGMAKKVRTLTGIPKPSKPSPKAMELARRLLAKAEDAARLARYGYSGKLTPRGI